jgi:hypothetical protein
MQAMWKSLAVVTAMLMGTNAFGRVHEIRIPLDNGRVTTGEISRRLAEDLHVPEQVAHRLNINLSLSVRGISGWLAVQGANSALGDGFHLSVSDDALIVEIDPEKLPRDWSETALTVRKFTEKIAPDATARQRRRFGLLLPSVVDPARPLVIVVHGLDGDACSCVDLCKCLREDGQQAAMFSYPAEQPLNESALFFTSQMKALRETFPTMKTDLVTESMGGLIARKYIEGPEYLGGVDRLILIAPPNQGSNWTGYASLQKICTNFTLWRTDKNWSPSWMITEGLLEAAKDLKPGSVFLKELNALPRRADVRYTIIAGDQPVHDRVESDLLAKSAGWIGGRTANWWGFRQTRAALVREAGSLREKTGSGDGPVKVEQAKLAGVDDFVTVKADHTALFYETDGRAPAAWPVVRERLDGGK